MSTPRSFSSTCVRESRISPTMQAMAMKASKGAVEQHFPSHRSLRTNVRRGSPLPRTASASPRCGSLLRGATRRWWSSWCEAVHMWNRWIWKAPLYKNASSAEVLSCFIFFRLRVWGENRLEKVLRCSKSKFMTRLQGFQTVFHIWQWLIGQSHNTVLSLIHI